MDKVKSVFFFLFFLLFCENAIAQYISGRVVDNAGEPIPFATIVVQMPDSTFVDGTLTDTIGAFRVVSNLKTFQLIVSHVQFETHVTIENKSEVGTVVLQEKDNLLDELVVKGQRPMVKMEQGKLTYDAERIAQAKVVSNVYDLLLQMPGVRSENGHLTLIGANGVTIVLNGKPTTMKEEQLMELLKNMPVSRIEKVEVMYSAPPKYHVRGAVINLKVKGYQSESAKLEGEINATYAQKYYANALGGVSLIYSSPKLTADLLYNTDYKKEKEGMDLYSMHTLNNQIYEIEQFNNGYSKGMTHNVRMGLDYHFTEKDKLSVVYTTALSPNMKKIQASNGNYSHSTNEKHLDEYMHNLAIDYTSHSGFNAGIDYIRYYSPTVQFFNNFDNYGDRQSFRVNASQIIDKWRGYLDGEQQLSKGWGLSYGAEFVFAKDCNSQMYHVTEQNDMSAMNTGSNIKEYTYNIYAGLEKSFDKVSMSLSMSGEYYQLGNYKNWAIYPALQLTYLPATGHILQFSLSSDKLYPDYWEMQDAVSYLNGYSELHGNSLLRPSKDYAVQLAYVLKNRYILNAYYNTTVDYFQQQPYPALDRLALIYQTINFDCRKKAGLSVVIPFNMNNVLDSRLTLDGSYNKVKSENFHDMALDNQKLVGYVRLDNTLNISSKPNIKLELAASYMSPSIQGVYDLSSLWGLDAGVKWISGNERTEIRLKGVDLFNSFTPDAFVCFQNQHLETVIKSDKRVINFSVVYKFGSYKAPKRKVVDTLRFGVK